MRKFFGREEQLEKLDALWRKGTSSFVVIAGRRRIGKSTLVEEFAARSRCAFIELVGLAPDEKMSNQRQIDSRVIGRSRPCSSTRGPSIRQLRRTAFSTISSRRTSCSAGN